MTPQLLWRWELGGGHGVEHPARRLPDGPELASSLSFYLTDLPPDDMLVAAASAGTLRAKLATHVDRILSSDVKDWLTATVMETYFTLNQLPGASPIDSGKVRRSSAAAPSMPISRCQSRLLPGRRACGTARSWT